MIQTVSTPWKAVVTGIVGLILGYALVIAQQGPSAFASAPQCPAHKAACTGGNCMKDSACTGKNCQHDCPGCTAQPATI